MRAKAAKFFLSMREVCAKFVLVKIPTSLLTALFLASAIEASPKRVPSAETVFQYDPKVVTLKGTLLTRVYPGPPNYESVKMGDKPERIWLIKLPRPISVDGEKEPALFNENEIGITEAQTILTDLKGEHILKKHKGETVTLTGTLFHANTIHHHLTLLMDVQSFALVPQGSNR